VAASAGGWVVAVSGADQSWEDGAVDWAAAVVFVRVVVSEAERFCNYMRNSCETLMGITTINENSTDARARR
jgi:hypothetical protein